jgi:hypothetical protein
VVLVCAFSLDAVWLVAVCAHEARAEAARPAALWRTLMIL